MNEELGTVDENEYCPCCGNILDYVDEGKECDECGWNNFKD